MCSHWSLVRNCRCILENAVELLVQLLCREVSIPQIRNHVEIVVHAQVVCRRWLFVEFSLQKTKFLMEIFEECVLDRAMAKKSILHQKRFGL